MLNVLNEMQKCCGCRTCEQLCPAKAITMVINEEGFLYPHINEDDCTNCGLCTNSCPQLKSVEGSNKHPQVYAAVHKNEAILKDSSSGGAFSALAELFFEKGGAVVGCAFDENFTARQVMIEDPALLSGLRGSKYVQSDTANTYIKTKRLLEDGRLVLYTGTPCQIGGLKAFLNKDYENLITVDLICHGVPSPKLFNEHVRWIEGKRNKKLKEYRFRSKINGNWSFYYYYLYADMAKLFHGSAALDPYFAAFLQGKTHRECCYQCPYARIDRVGDFTIADYWNVASFHPELKNVQGVSLIMVNTARAARWAAVLSEKMHMIPSRIEWIKKINYNLNRPAKRPMERDEIYKYISNIGYAAWAKRYQSGLKYILLCIHRHLPLACKKMIRRMTKSR